MLALDYIRASTLTSTLEYHTIIMELRTDVYYEYDAIFKVVRIFQVIERSKLMTDFVLVGYEYAGSESQADQVVMQFRMTNKAPVLPRIEVDE